MRGCLSLAHAKLQAGEMGGGEHGHACAPGGCKWTVASSSLGDLHLRRRESAEGWPEMLPAGSGTRRAGVASKSQVNAQVLDSRAREMLPDE